MVSVGKGGYHRRVGARKNFFFFVYRRGEGTAKRVSLSKKNALLRHGGKIIKGRGKHGNRPDLAKGLKVVVEGGRWNREQVLRRGSGHRRRSFIKKIGTG